MKTYISRNYPIHNGVKVQLTAFQKKGLVYFFLLGKLFIVESEAFHKVYQPMEVPSTKN